MERIEDIIINGASFGVVFYDTDEANSKTDKFISMYKRVSKKLICHNVRRVICGDVSLDNDFILGTSLRAYVSRLEKDKRSLMLGIFANSGYPCDGESVICEGREMIMCLFSSMTSSAFLSIESASGFAKDKLEIIKDGLAYSVRNISNEDHIYKYRDELGVRVYRANSGKHTNKKHEYGKGKVASPMNLNDNEAQELLNKAITVGDRLYARKNGINYAFMYDGIDSYHGFEHYELGDNILKELDKIDWD